MFARAVVRHEVHEDANAAAVRLTHELAEVVIGAVRRIHMVVVGDVVAVIARRLRDGHEPDAVGAEVGIGARVAVVDVIQTTREPLEIADSIAVAVDERADEYFVAHGVTPPGARRWRGLRGGYGRDEK